MCFRELRDETTASHEFGGAQGELCTADTHSGMALSWDDMDRASLGPHLTTEP